MVIDNELIDASAGRPLEEGAIVEAQLQYEVVLIDRLVLLQQVHVDAGVVEDAPYLRYLPDGVPEEEVALGAVVQYQAVFVFILAEVGRRTEARVAQAQVLVQVVEAVEKVAKFAT